MITKTFFFEHQLEELGFAKKEVWFSDEIAAATHVWKEGEAAIVIFSQHRISEGEYVIHSQEIELCVSPTLKKRVSLFGIEGLKLFIRSFRTFAEIEATKLTCALHPFALFPCPAVSPN